MTSPYLTRPLRELEEIASNLRAVIAAAAGEVAYSEEMRASAQTLLDAAEGRMEVIQDAIAHRVRGPVVIALPAPIEARLRTGLSAADISALGMDKNPLRRW